MDSVGFLDFINNLMDAFFNMGEFLNKPIIDIGGITFTVLGVFSLAGITTFIVVAVVKWAVS